MSKKIIVTGRAPTPGGHHSQAVRIGNDIYVSGSGPFDPKTHEIVPGGIEEQPRQTLNNVAAVLEADGSSLRDVVRVTVYMKNINDFEAMDSAYKAYFPQDPPARTTVQTVLYGKERLIVIDAIARIQ
jgi:2-iminobutanoate/2-iminopropanoate deaminase